MAVKLRPHQEKVLPKIHNGCILYGGVGSGKSITALVYYVRSEAPKDVYVLTTARKRDSLDWEGEAAKLAISTDADSSYYGVLTVDSWNNIGKYVDVKDAFFIFDEQRVVGSGAWSKNFVKIAKKNRWILLSATPGDTWLDYIPVFVANGFFKNRTEFKREHVVYSHHGSFPKVERFLGQGKLLKLRAQILVEMPFVRETVRHVEYVDVDYDKDLYRLVMKDRWNPYTEKPIRNVSELFHTLRKVVNSDPSRSVRLLELIRRHKSLIVFYTFDYELEALRELARGLQMPFAEWNGHKHEPLPTGPAWLYLVQMTSGAEAWNCTTTDAMVFWSLNYSWRLNEQSRGRIDRLNTPFKDLWYYYLRSRSSIDLAILKALSAKKDFNERNSKVIERG